MDSPQVTDALQAYLQAMPAAKEAALKAYEQAIEAQVLAELAKRDGPQYRCERCGMALDGSAYHQTEWGRFGGRRIQMTAYYCPQCRQLLGTIGAGEITALEERKGEK